MSDPCEAHDGMCDNDAALVLDIYALGQSMQMSVCVDHYRALAATGVQFLDRRPDYGAYTVPDDALIVVLVGDLRGGETDV